MFDFKKIKNKNSFNYIFFATLQTVVYDMSAVALSYIWVPTLSPAIFLPQYTQLVNVYNGMQNIEWNTLQQREREKCFI